MHPHNPEANSAAKLVLGGLSDLQHVSLCETLDRVLNKGVVVAGEVTISVAEVDLVYLSLHLVLCSMETARRGESGSTGPSVAMEKEYADAVG